MIPFVQEVRLKRKQREAVKKYVNERLGMAFQGKGSQGTKRYDGKLISKNLLLILNGQRDFFDQNP